jgi:RsiW-degrading membrane proteinase PrsW (M82 family)
MTDAFDRLNDAVPIFFIFLTASLVVSLRLTMRQLYSLFMPLIAGPAICVVGWYLTEDFDDPNWFQLCALATIGMLVSCLVTALLAGMANNPTEPRIAPKLR